MQTYAEGWMRLNASAIAAGIDDRQAITAKTRSADSTRGLRSPYVLRMRLSEYPYVVVRVGCARCARWGTYRLARLADRYGSETALPHVLEMLSADCKLREQAKISIYDRCGAYFPDIGGARPPDEPTPARPKLRAVK